MTKTVMIGAVQVGGTAPVSIQTMTTTDTCDAVATAGQINGLKGCDIVRVAVPTLQAANAIYDIKSRISIPLVADVHFDANIALRSIEAGADKLRINPGNMPQKHIQRIAEAANKRGIPIRVGANLGSLPKDILSRSGRTAAALCESVCASVALLEAFDFNNIVVSAKASHVPTMVSAYHMLSEQLPYPLHLGVTEAGLTFDGLIYSAVGIGSLLLEGIGNTIRVSLTDDPSQEVRAAKSLLAATGKRQNARLICCPTCGRCQYNLRALACRVEQALQHTESNITVAVMGCAVNGPGEAAGADIGIAGGANGMGALFECGKVVKTGRIDALTEELLEKLAHG